MKEKERKEKLEKVKAHRERKANEKRVCKDSL